jgi:hypothetical protein
LHDGELKDYSGAQDLATRAVYVIIFQDGFMRQKVMRIVESFSGKNFDVPAGGDPGEIRNGMVLLSSRISEAATLIDTTRFRLKEYLRDIQKLSEG